MRISDRPYYPAKEIGFYARRVLRELNLRDPPIPVEPVLDYFGISLLSIDYAGELEYKRLFGTELPVPAFLIIKDDQPYIGVKKSDLIERQRMSIFHECGHLDIPWHSSQSYLCDCTDNVIQTKPLEKEAFEYAGHILFPREPFVTDVNELPISLTTINELSQKYEVSFAATAIKYIRSHPGLCAILYLEELPKTIIPGPPFVVRYSIKSDEFHRYWKPGQPVAHHDLISYCFEHRVKLKGTIPATVFGSHKKHEYAVQIRPYGIDQVCVLLSMEDRQTSVF